MSRICVKGIGKSANEQSLRDLFSAKGEVTDVKLLMTKDGKPRKIAFIGFRTDIQANEAQKYFNNTFMGLSKIVVEIAKKVNDQTLLDAKMKHQKKGKDGKPIIEVEDKQVNTKKEKDVKQAAQKEATMSKNKVEFMEVMKNRRNAKFWTNDDVVGNDNAATVASSGLTMGKTNLVGKSVESKLMVEESDSDVSDSDMNDFSSNKSAVQTALKLKNKFHKNTEESDESDSEETAKKSSGMSDLDYLKSKSTYVDSDDEEEEDEGEQSDKNKHATKSHKSQQSDSDNESDMEVEKPKKIYTKDRIAANKKRSNSVDSTDSLTQFAQQNEANFSTKSHPKATAIELEDDIEDSSRLFVKNLPFTCTEEEFSTLFSKYGVISEVHLPIDKEKKGKGFGFILFLIPEHANAAMADLSGSSFQGRLLHITKANRKIDYGALAIEKAAADGTTVRPNSKLSSFQQKKEEERKKFANKQEGWNSAFVRSDTVVESLADKYGISRSAILDTSEGGGELAVRLAIGETQVITENREYFLAHGVDISALESAHSDNRAAKRSSTTILVKNLPFDLIEDEVESMFARFGTITAFLVPKSRTIALIDFVEPTEARAAYKGLAYRSYKHMPMYLEWAPVGVIDKDKATAATTALKAKQTEITNKKNKTQSDLNKTTGDSNDPSAEDNLDEYSTLFIKNLNFITTELNLKDHCNHMRIEGLRTIHIQKKQIGNSILSQGYGFAEFSSHKAAQDAMVKLNGSLIDSHALVVKPSDKRLTIRPVTLKTNSTSNTVTANANKNGGQVQTPGNNKLIVRNVAFQATKHEIRALFSAFGAIKRVRIPKKMGGDHRGFAFVDFTTAQEAATAMASLKDTHLYGRHLVLEWAKEEEEEDGNGGPLDVIKNIDALRKRARADETVIRTDHKNKRAKETIDETMGGPGSDDI